MILTLPPKPPSHRVLYIRTIIPTTPQEHEANQTSNHFQAIRALLCHVVCTSLLLSMRAGSRGFRCADAMNDSGGARRRPYYCTCKPGRTQHGMAAKYAIADACAFVFAPCKQQTLWHRFRALSRICLSLSLSLAC